MPCFRVLNRGSRYERNPHSESFQAMADAIGCDPMSLIYDALVAEKVLWAPLSRNPNQDMPIDMLKHPNVSAAQYYWCRGAAGICPLRFA